MVVTQAMGTGRKAFDALLNFTTTVLLHPKAKLQDRGDALESVIEDFFFFAATCAVEFNTADKSFEAEPLMMEPLFTSLVLPRSNEVEDYMRQAKIPPSVLEVKSVPSDEAVLSDNTVYLEQNNDAIYIQKAVDGQKGFDFAITIPTNKGELVLMIEPHGHCLGREWEEEKKEFTTKRNACKDHCRVSIVTKIPNSYSSTSDLSHEFKNHLKDHYNNRKKNGVGAAVMCLQELKQFLGPFWNVFAAAAIKDESEDPVKSGVEGEGEGDGEIEGEGECEGEN